MNLQKTLDSLQPYVIGIRYLENIVVLDCMLKDGWVIPESKTIEKRKVNESENYYILHGKEFGVTLDDLINYIKTIISLNKEREDKQKLYKEMVEKLKFTFKNNSLENLARLKFVFNEPSDELEMDDLVMDDLDAPLAVEQIQEPITQPITQPVDDRLIVNDNPVTLTYEEQEILEEEERGKRNLAILNRKKEISNNQPLKAATIVKQQIELPPQQMRQSSVCNCVDGEACEKCIDSQDY
jgi:hypothetical protein